MIGQLPVPKKLKTVCSVNGPSAFPSHCYYVSAELLELFISLDATDEQLNYPIIYASAREGWANKELGAQTENIFPLLDKILDHVPSPQVDRSKPFSMLITVCLIYSIMNSSLNENVKSKWKMTHTLESATSAVSILVFFALETRSRPWMETERLRVKENALRFSCDKD